MDLHILSDSSTDFCKCPKKGLIMLLFTILTKVGGLIGSTKTQFKHLNFGIVVNWPKFILFVKSIIFFFLTQKRWFRGSLRSDFDKIIDQSNVNGVSWGKIINS